LVNFYQDLLTESCPNISKAIAKITRHIPSLISNEQNVALLRPITLEELDLAIKEMPTSKSLGSDGFTMDLFQHRWHLVQEEVWQLIEDLKLKSGASGFKRYFSHHDPKRGERLTSQAILAYCTLQRHLQNLNQGNWSSTQTHSSFHHFA
jgi:hypothetical protein